MNKELDQEFYTSMCGTHSPWDCAEFPPARPAADHTIMYERRGESGQLFPLLGEDVWDEHHVKMPCSDKNVSVVDSSGNVQKTWVLIVQALSKPISNSQDLMDAILSYQTENIDRWNFEALHKFFNEDSDEKIRSDFFDIVLPQIAELALELPELIKSPIPLLQQEENKSLSFTQVQLASLLANAFFCTFPDINNDVGESKYRSFYPPINFNSLYNERGLRATEKIKCICNYFSRVCTKRPSGVVTFSRRHVPLEHCPDWTNNSTPIDTIPLLVDKDMCMEEAHGCIQVDFANKYIGAGSIRGGATQEEILFVLYPELIASLLFTEVLKPTETVMVIGTERFNSHTGYGSTFKWAGDYIDDTPRDSSGRRRCAILVMDAICFPNAELQYVEENVTRELNKAWIGFSFYTNDNSGLNYPGVATGNWGCGAFGGSPHLKALLQLMSCVLARRPMAYTTYGDQQLNDDIAGMYALLVENGVTVGELYKYILSFCESNADRKTLYKYLKKKIRKEDNAYCAVS